MTMASKPAPKKKRTKSVISERHETVAQAMASHMTQAQAALEAGYKGQAGVEMALKIPEVKERLAEIRAETSDLVKIKRIDVINGFLAAIDMAKLSADPASMIRGWSEIGKMLGLYAPEVVDVRLTTGQRALKSKYEVMSDEDLLAIAEGRVIEGEYATVN